MANPQHLEWLNEGVEAWNARMEREPFVADFSGADLRGANLQSTNLSNANLRRADLTDADLLGSNLSNVNAIGATFVRANLSQIQGQDADFRRAMMEECIFDEAHLMHADFQEANLIRADFELADLSYADLIGADLRGALFDGTDIHVTDFSEANISTIIEKNGNVKFTTFNEVRGVSKELLKSADGDWGTYFDSFSFDSSYRPLHWSKFPIHDFDVLIMYDAMADQELIRYLKTYFASFGVSILDYHHTVGWTSQKKSIELAARNAKVVLCVWDDYEFDAYLDFRLKICSYQNTRSKLVNLVAHFPANRLLPDGFNSLYATLGQFGGVELNQLLEQVRYLVQRSALGGAHENSVGLPYAASIPEKLERRKDFWPVTTVARQLTEAGKLMYFASQLQSDKSYRIVMQEQPVQALPGQRDPLLVEGLVNNLLEIVKRAKSGVQGNYTPHLLGALERFEGQLNTSSHLWPILDLGRGELEICALGDMDEGVPGGAWDPMFQLWMRKLGERIDELEPYTKVVGADQFTGTRGWRVVGQRQLDIPTLAEDMRQLAETYQNQFATAAVDHISVMAERMLALYTPVPMTAEDHDRLARMQDVYIFATQMLASLAEVSAEMNPREQTDNVNQIMLLTERAKELAQSMADTIEAIDETETKAAS